MALAESLQLLLQLGIGFLLGAAASYYLLRERLRQYQDGNALRKISLLEQVAQHVGKVTHVFSKYVSLVNDIGPRREKMTAKQERELEQLSQALVDVYEEISMAEAKLLLIAEKRLHKALTIYTANMAQFSKQFYPGRYSQEEDLATQRREISRLREQFYDTLSERYDQLNP